MQIEAVDIKFTYMPGTPFAVTALNGVNIKFEEGGFTGIIGRTGCGKSTLIQVLSGLIKPDSGTVLLNYEDINAEKYNKKLLRKNVGVVFQYPEYQLFEETVEKDVAFGPRKIGMSENEIQSAVNEAIELVGLNPSKVKDVSPFDLSGGQKRKVAIAGVLAMRPKILILDEPVAGLDPLGRESFMDLLKGLNAAGITIIMISHNMDGLCDCATRVIAMDSGSIVLDGTPVEVFSRYAELKNFGLNAGEAKNMARLLNDRGFYVPDDIITIDGLSNYLIERLTKKDDA